MQTRRPAVYLRTCLTLVLVLGVLACDKHKQLREVALRGEEVYKQYRTADYATAKEALLSFIRELESRIADTSDPNGKTYNADIMFSYARLAKLEEKNNGSEKEAYTQRAIVMCQQMPIKRTCSAEALRADVDAIDALPVK